MRPLNFLILSTTDWDAPQFGSRQAIARSLARRGHEVFFVEVPRALHSLISDPGGVSRALRRRGTHRVVEDRLIAYTPRAVLPVYYHPWSSTLNLRLLRRDIRRVLGALRWQPDVLWTYWPNTAALGGSFGDRFLVYHCIDDFAAVTYPLVRPGIIAGMEADLCRRADLVLASTEQLAKRAAAFGARAAVHLPTGVDIDAFDPARVLAGDAEVLSQPAPRAGFVGTLDDRIDVDLVVECARQLPQMTFVFVGPVKRHRLSIAALARLANVRLLAPRPHDDMPAVLAAFDAAILPYRRTAFTENLAPAKLYEYLAMGTPTVSTDLPFVRRAAAHVRIVDDGAAMAAALREIVEQPPRAPERDRWRAAAARNSWELRVDQIEALLEERFDGGIDRSRRVSVLQVVASSRGGGATHVRDLAAGLDHTRFAVEVAMPADGGHVGLQDFQRQGIPYHRIGLDTGVPVGALGELRRLLARFDVVHVHGARAAFWVRSVALALSLPRPRIVYTIHGFTVPADPWWRRALLRWGERALARVTDLYIAVCKSEREALLRARWCAPGRLEVVRNGIAALRVPSPDRAGLRRSLAVPEGASLATTVCRLNRPRDFETLLSAFCLVVKDEPAAHLLVVGDGPWAARIRDARDRRGLSAAVTLAGQREDIAAVLEVSDVFVLTSSGGDGLPIGILEAMAAGLPVIATAVDGIPEAVIDGENGLLVGRADARSLADALLRLLREPETRRAFGDAGRRCAEWEFGTSRMAAELAEYYLRVLRSIPRS
jgi:glycosyltransferase involved in cell wall biosynthesis